MHFYIFVPLFPHIWYVSEATPSMSSLVPLFPLIWQCNTMLHWKKLNDNHTKKRHEIINASIIERNGRDFPSKAAFRSSDYNDMKRCACGWYRFLVVFSVVELFSQQIVNKVGLAKSNWEALSRCSFIIPYGPQIFLVLTLLKFSYISSNVNHNDDSEEKLHRIDFSTE